MQCATNEHGWQSALCLNLKKSAEVSRVNMADFHLPQSSPSKRPNPFDKQLGKGQHRFVTLGAFMAYSCLNHKRQVSSTGKSGLDDDE